MADGPQSKSGSDFPDFTKLFADMKLPAMPDMDAFIAANRRNMETLATANRVALEGAQAVARRHMEIMQQSIAELTEAMQALATTDGPQAKAAKQAEMLKGAYERALANMQEMRTLIERSSTEALGVLTHRFTEAMDEVKTMLDKAK